MPQGDRSGTGRSLRFSPKICYLNPDGSKSEICALIAAIRNSEGKLIAVHKTFLTKDGKKASVETPKKISCLPSNVSLTGCGIRIGNPTKYLAVTEGIETALSVSIATGLPCWSCVNAHLLETVVVPASVEVVFIFADVSGNSFSSGSKGPFSAERSHGLHREY